MDLSLTQHDWIFIGWFVSIWFILSFFMLVMYAIWEDRKKNKYQDELFTIKDIFLMILFAPLTIVFGICYVLVWFVMRVLHFEDVVDWLSDFMNTPIKFRKRKEDGQ